MPQIIACKNKNEIILATDSKIVEIDPEGNLSQYIHPFRLYLLRTKKKLPQIDVDEIATAYAVPRLITLKHRLTQQYNANKPLKEILPIIQEALTKQSSLSDDIDGLFHFAHITRDGFDRPED